LYLHVELPIAGCTEHQDKSTSPGYSPSHNVSFMFLKFKSCFFAVTFGLFCFLHVEKCSLADKFILLVIICII